VLKKPMW